MLIHGMHLYDLSNVYPAWAGYYIDADFNIYAHLIPRHSKMQRLIGIKTDSGRVYSLHQFLYSIAYIKAMVLRNADTFYRETRSTAPAENMTQSQPAPEQTSIADQETDENQSPSQCSHASTITEGIKARGVVIGCVIDDRLVFGTNPKIHTTESSWRKEIERLARNNPDMTFVFLQIGGGLTVGKVTWL